MRTVIVHLKNASKTAVVDWLNSFARSQGGPEFPWLYPKQGDPVLYITLHEVLGEPEEMKTVIARLGGNRAVSIVADVSGRDDGTDESIALVSGLLRKFDGVAKDDFTDHFWTLAEIERGHLEDGSRFFDFRKAYDSRP